MEQTPTENPLVRGRQVFDGRHRTKYIMLSLFVSYISDVFTERQAELKAACADSADDLYVDAPADRAETED